jgi:hypothetical protein
MKTRRIFLTGPIIAVLFIISINGNAQEKKVVVEPKKATGTSWTGVAPRGAAGGVWSISEGKSTRLILKKIYQMESVSKESEFEVEKDQRMFKVSISGHCAQGEIHVTVLRPSGKVYKTVVLDSSADIEWSQSVRFTEEDNDYVGKWIVQIVAKEADGIYEVILTAN